ncbi:MAG: preprotein translocase subunit YajC [Rhodospirillales bacterium]|nr:preprotein translocase subunit YajC [Rhodospirillales bacterium]MBO6786490.1 preprotein translocase subunit YajC [Rhodospirillales bacterium]
MFISEAYAQAAGGAGGGNAFQAFLPLILIFVVFYFLLIRPQQKKIKQHKELLESIRRGDKVITGGGIIGTVTKVDNDNELTVEIAKDVKVKVQRSTISGVVNRTEPVAGSAANDAGEKKQGGLLSQLFGGGSKPAAPAPAPEADKADDTAEAPASEGTADDAEKKDDTKS